MVNHLQMPDSPLPALNSWHLDLAPGSCWDLTAKMGDEPQNSLFNDVQWMKKWNDAEASNLDKEWIKYPVSICILFCWQSPNEWMTHWVHGQWADVRDENCVSWDCGLAGRLKSRALESDSQVCWEAFTTNYAARAILHRLVRAPRLLVLFQWFLGAKSTQSTQSTQSCTSDMPPFSTCARNGATVLQISRAESRWGFDKGGTNDGGIDLPGHLQELPEVCLKIFLPG